MRTAAVAVVGVCAVGLAAALVVAQASQAGDTRERAGNFDVVADAVQTVCPACTDQIVGSAFLTRLNAGSETVPGVNYTVIATKNDQIVTPFTSGFLEGPGVDNITLQDACADDTTEHIGLSFSDAALTLVLNALDPRNPREIPCP